jgi:hypothetical protein
MSDGQPSDGQPLAVLDGFPYLAGGRDAKQLVWRTAVDTRDLPGVLRGSGNRHRKHLAEGDSYMAGKKYAEAVPSSRNAVQQDAGYGEARLKLAEAYLAIDEARRVLSTIS